MDFQNTEDGGGQQVQVSPDSLSHEFSRVLDLNPTLLDDEEGDDPKPKPKPTPTGNEGMIPKVWKKVKYLLNPMEGLRGAKQAEDAITRGALKGIDALSNTVVRGGVELSKKTGLYKVGRDEQEQDDFLNWWDQKTAKANPLQFGDERIDRWYGPSQGGLTGFVESASQFAVGMATAGKVIKTLPGVSSLAGAGVAGSIGANALAGAGADMTAFDPHASRLSNLIEEHGPTWLRNDVTKFLAAKEDDSEMLGRIKNGLEGMMIGSTIDSLIHGIRGLKAWVRGDKAEAAKLFQEAGEISQKPRPDEAVTVVETPDGHYAVEQNGAKPVEQNGAQPMGAQGVGDLRRALSSTSDVLFVETANGTREQVQHLPVGRLTMNADEVMLEGGHSIDVNAVHKVVDASGNAVWERGNGNKAQAVVPDTPQGPVYATRAKAENVAATMNLAAKNEALAKGTFDQAGTEQFQQAMKAYADGADPRTVAQHLDDYGINTNYVQAPEEVVNTIKSMVDVMPEPSTMTRNRPKTWAETAKRAEDVFPGMSGDEVVTRMADIYGTTEHLDTYVDAARVWLWKQAGQVKKLSQLADANPENALAYDQLARALDTMLEFHAYFTGTNSNVARALNINKRPVGEALDQAAKEVASGIDSPEAIRAEAQALGADVDEAALQAAQEEVKQAKEALAGPNTETVMDKKAIAEQQKANVEAGTVEESTGTGGSKEPVDIENQGLNDGTRDTEGVNATDFSLARKREKALAAIEKVNKLLNKKPKEVPQLDPEVVADNRSLRGERTKMQADAQRADPLEAPEVPAGARGPVNPIEDLSKLLDQADNDLSASLESARKRRAPKEQKQKLDHEVSPVDTYRVQNGPRSVANMTQAEVRAFARLVSMGDDPKEVLDLLRGPKMKVPAEIAARANGFKKWTNYVIGFRMEAMLSGPKTQIVNTVNNAIAMLQRPAEYWWAGVRSGNADLRQMGADIIGGLWENHRESWAAAKKAFGDGTNVLDAHNTHTGGSLAKWGDASWLSRIYHAPSRFLLGGDEFFKQMNYRANLRARILRQTREAGITDPKTIAERLKDGMAVGFNPEGGAVSPSALEYARVGTFTNELKTGLTNADGSAHKTIGEWLQKGVQEHPMLRVIMPFVRTPVNIFRYAWERTPGLNFMQKQFRAEWAAGGERRAIAQAKLEMGVAMYGTAGLFALTGNITGAGPSDPDLRRQWKEAGHQPYSVKIPGTDRWVSYRRLDPTFAPFGLVADIVQISGELSDGHRENVAAAVVASIMSNISSKTFMQGATEFMDAMSSGRGDVVENLLSSVGGSFIPNIARQLNTDDTIRETRGLVDEVMARIPGFSQKLEPRRNLFGEKVLLPPGYFNRSLNPFTLSAKPQNQNVADELLRLGKAFSMPAETKFNGLIDLTDKSLSETGKQSPYDRMLELMSTPLLDGQSLRQKLEELVQSDEYKSASEDKYVNVGGLKWQLANAYVQGYQEAAFAQLMEEMPKLQTAVEQAAELQGASLTEGSKGVEDVMQRYTQLFARPKRK